MPFLFQLQFTAFSAFWVIFSLILGLAYAFLLYGRASETSLGLRKFLFVFRTLAVALIAFLLFAPFIKITSKTVEKPLVFILQDNSASVRISQAPGFNLEKYTRDLNVLEENLQQDYEVRTLSFGNRIQSGLKSAYREKRTDIGGAFRYISETFSNRNIGAVILSSDGIYNSGGNPLYLAQNIKAPVYSVALGDTVPKKDLLIANVNFNHIVYLGNDFQIEINVEAYQSKGSSSRLSVSDKNGVLVSKTIQVNSDEFRTSIPLILPAKKKGIQRFTVSLSPLKGELSAKNNSRTFFIEVIDGSQKVFILANAPHPDITALKQSIESNKNYEVKTGFAGSFDKEDLKEADLIVLHQLPSFSSSFQAIGPSIGQKNLWYILGAQSNTSDFSSAQDVLNISSTGGIQESFAVFNSGFSEFVLSEETKSKLQKFAPLLTPFGNYGFKSQTTVLLNQRIGRLNTDRPLLVFSKQENRKIAVLSGEGIWRWRLDDFQENNNHDAVNELLSKTVQYLSSKEDKRKFRVYPAKSSFDESEHIILNAELYNNAYELINTPEVKVTLKNTNGKSYSFIFSKSGNSYIVDAGVLPAGEYSFLAGTQLGESKYSANGQFVITEQQVEYAQTIANHQLLYNLARQSSGELLSPAELSTLPERIRKNEYVKTISYEDRRYEEMIDVKWLFFLILALISLEWFSRKRNGVL